MLDSEAITEAERGRRAADLLDTHGVMISTALRAYIENMRASAEELNRAWLAVKDDPEKRAEQDKSGITTDGLHYSARGILEAVERAEHTLAAVLNFEDGVWE